MNRALVECVPNFSEGRDPAKIEQILEAARQVEGVDILDVDGGQETNRTVVTLLGSPEAIAEAAFQVIKRAAEVIDMSKHQGAHARHGATDVCPFVPVAGVTMADCVRIAEEVGERVGRELSIPVYLYDQAARLPERRSLAKVRAGEYEALPDKMSRPEWKPDFGPAEFHSRAGVVTIGAREFLIAYNINLNTRAKAHADDIAWELREKGRAVRRGQATPYYSSGSLVKYSPKKNSFPSAYSDFVGTSLGELAEHYKELGRDLHEELDFFDRDPDDLEGKNVMRKGRFAECRGVGWVIPEYGRAQISLNLTNFKITPAHDVVDACSALATERGLTVTGSEVVGLMPYEAIKASGEHYLAKQGSCRGLPYTDVVETAVQSLGLRDVAEFDAEKSILGLPSTDGPLVSMKVNELADEVSRPSPAPGGGSIAALAGSMAASLASMVANLTHGKKKYADRREDMESVALDAQRLKDDLLRLIDADTDAFGEVLTAMRLPKGSEKEKAARAAAILAGYKCATEVPLRTAGLCVEAMELCLKMAEGGLPASVTDAGVGALMGRAGVLGAIYNVKINLGSIKDPAWVSETRGKLQALQDRANDLEATISGIVEASFARESA